MHHIRMLFAATCLASAVAAQSPSQQNRSGAFFRATSPFGLRAGMSEADVRRVAQLRPMGIPGTFMTEALPEGWPGDVSAYVLDFSDRRGLCKLAALTGATGDEAWLRQRFELLRMKLAAIYGQPKDYKGYETGATLTDPKRWTEAIAKKEAVHSSAWLKSEGATLPAGIDGIILDVQGQAANKLIVAAQFYFGSEKQCLEERKTG